DADDATLDNCFEALQPGLLQLLGDESVARIRDIRQKFGLPVMKALPVATTDDLTGLPGYAVVADRILFDARAPKDATRPGGLGVPFDWHLLENIRLTIPFMVGGGLNPGNVAEAIRVTRAGGVDVSSGVESAPGVKDPDLIRAFIRAAREADDAMTLSKIASSV
ncbi:MAG: phosphoribosylanthranilate isomerase, partial [Afipia sp.]